MRILALCLCLATLGAGCSKSADQTVRDVESSQPAQAARDALLAAAVKARVTAVDFDSATSVRVQAQNGHVTIRGVVHDAAKKAAMIKAAKDIPGVTTVSDQLTVNARAPRASKDFADLALAARVDAALAAQTGINALSVHVRAHDGRVTIEGSAPSGAIKDTIIVTARKVSAVRAVVDRIRVHP